MNKLLLATLSSLGALTISVANAADLPRKAPAPVVVAPACAQFGGFYIGANVGYASAEHRHRDLDGLGPIFGFPGESTRGADGGTAGVQGGWNWQTRCTVFGIEADYNWADAGREAVFNQIGAPGTTLAVSNKLQGFGTVRARTGVVVDNLMLYVTGGLAYSFTERNVALQIAPGFVDTFSSDKSRLGWTLGLGTEWQFAPSWSFKSEVLFARFQREENTFNCVVLCGGLPARFEFESSAWVARVGINYRFGGSTLGTY